MQKGSDQLYPGEEMSSWRYCLLSCRLKGSYGQIDARVGLGMKCILLNKQGMENA